MGLSLKWCCKVSVRLEFFSVDLWWACMFSLCGL